MLKVLKKGLSAALFATFACLPCTAQQYVQGYGVLRLPASSHAAALGGENISNIDDEPAAGWANPALLSVVSDKSIGLNFMTYNSGSIVAGAQFVKAFGERHTGMVAAQYLGFGSMEGRDADGIETGKFTPKDIVIALGYSYLLSERWAGGATLKLTSQNYGGYSSFATSFDLGLNYFVEESDFSLSFAARNLGAQLKSFHNGQTLKLPFTLQAGLSKGFEHIPLRFTLTMTDLTRWSSDDYYLPEGKEKLGFGQLLLNHFVLGLDILPTDYLYLSAGYNFRRAYELKSAGSSKLAGLTFGGGLRLKRFKLGVSFAKYHVGNSSLMFNVGYAL
ncbi:MAG: type IX secretion system protein PorQ [Alloprevotella sp.]|nr:type IX secretion system protein PorQ [Alloprevotella sp.]MBR6339882.1 type IX secretion system protein PorQ [Alloprevotella sp.]